MEFAEQGFLRYEENGQKQGKGDENQGKGNIDRKQWNEGKKDENHNPQKAGKHKQVKKSSFFPHNPYSAI